MCHILYRENEGREKEGEEEAHLEMLSVPAAVLKLESEEVMRLVDEMMEMQQDGRGVVLSSSVAGTEDGKKREDDLKMSNTDIIREHPISGFFPSLLVLLSRSHDPSVTLELLRLLHIMLHYDSSSKPSLHSSSASPPPFLTSSSADTPLSHPLMFSFRAEFLRLGGPHLVSAALTRSHISLSYEKHGNRNEEKIAGNCSDANASAYVSTSMTRMRVNQSNVAVSDYKQPLLHLLLSFLFDMPPPTSAVQPGVPSSSLKPYLPQRGSLLLLQHLPLSIYGPLSHIPRKSSSSFYSLLPILPSLFSSLIPSLVSVASLSVHSCLVVNPLNLSLLEHHSVIQSMCSCLVSLTLHSSTSSEHNIEQREQVNFEPGGLHNSSKENSNDESADALQSDRYFDSSFSLIRFKFILTPLFLSVLD